MLSIAGSEDDLKRIEEEIKKLDELFTQIKTEKPFGQGDELPHK